MATKTGKHRDDTGRALHLLDLENLVGGRVTPDSVQLAWQRYVATVGIARGDNVVIGVANCNAATAAFNVPAKVQWAIGADTPDGADVALADAVDVHHAAARYQRIYLASCDHYFTGLASEFRTLGCTVTQVIGVARVSADLYRACNADIRLPRTLAA